MKQKKIRIGQHVFIVWPGLGVYDLKTGLFDFKRVEDLNVIEVLICGRSSKSSIISKVTGFEFWNYSLAFLSEEDNLKYRPASKVDWDRPFEWPDTLGESREEAVINALLEVEPLAVGYAKFITSLKLLSGS